MILPPDPGTTQAWLLFFTPIVGALILASQYVIKRLQDARAEKIKTALETAAQGTNQKMDTIHALVNSERGTLLEMYAASMELNAKFLKSAAARKLAKKARALSDDHNLKQAAVDVQAASQVKLL